MEFDFGEPVSVTRDAAQANSGDNLRGRISFDAIEPTTGKRTLLIKASVDSGWRGTRTMRIEAGRGCWKARQADVSGAADSLAATANDSGVSRIVIEVDAAFLAADLVANHGWELRGRTHKGICSGRSMELVRSGGIKPLVKWDEDTVTDRVATDEFARALGQYFPFSDIAKYQPSQIGDAYSRGEWSALINARIRFGDNQTVRVSVPRAEVTDLGTSAYLAAGLAHLQRRFGPFTDKCLLAIDSHTDLAASASGRVQLVHRRFPICVGAPSEAVEPKHQPTLFRRARLATASGQLAGEAQREGGMAILAHEFGRHIVDRLSERRGEILRALYRDIRKDVLIDIVGLRPAEAGLYDPLMTMYSDIDTSRRPEKLRLAISRLATHSFADLVGQAIADYFTSPAPSEASLAIVKALDTALAKAAERDKFDAEHADTMRRMGARPRSYNR